MIRKPITIDKFISDVTGFCKKHGISKRDIGVQSLNDSAFFLRLQKGKSPTLSRVETVYDFMIAFEATATEARKSAGEEPQTKA